MSIILRFSESTNLSSLAIKLNTWYWCSQVDVIFDDRGSEKRLYGAHPKTGVGYRSTKSTSDHRFEDYEVAISAIKKFHFMEKLVSQKGKPYDNTATRHSLFYRDRNWKNEDSWFCSELIAWAFDTSGFPLIRTEHKTRILPKDLLMSPHLSRVSKTNH